MAGDVRSPPGLCRELIYGASGAEKTTELIEMVRKLEGSGLVPVAARTISHGDSSMVDGDALRPLRLTLQLGQGAASVSLVRGPPAEIAAVARALSLVTPDWVGVTDPGQLGALPQGSTVLCGLDEDSAQWLNLRRNAISTHRLRLVLWGAPELRLRGLAPDLDSWVGRVIDLPERPPGWAVERLRSAAGGRVRWVGGDWAAVAAAAFPALRTWEVEACESMRLSAEALADPSTLPVLRDLRGPMEAQRLRWALTRARRRGPTLVVESAEPIEGFTEVDGRPLSWAEAAERLGGGPEGAREAALLGLDPLHPRLRLPVADGSDSARPLVPTEQAALDGEAPPSKWPAADLPDERDRAAWLSAAFAWPSRCPEPLALALSRWALGEGEEDAVLGLFAALREAGVALGPACLQIELEALLSNALPSTKSLLEIRIADLRRHPDSSLADRLWCAAAEVEVLYSLGGLNEAHRRGLRLTAEAGRLLGRTSLPSVWAASIAWYACTDRLPIGARLEELAELLQAVGPEDGRARALLLRNQAEVADAVDGVEVGPASAVAALAEAGRSFGNRHPETILCLQVLHSARLRRAELPVEEAAREAETVRRRVGGEHLLFLEAERKRASALVQAGALQEAVEATERLVSTAARLLGDGHPRVATLRYEEADLWMVVGRPQAALDLARRSQLSWARSVSATSWQVVRQRTMMANVERELGQLEAALNHARSAVRLAEETLEPRHPDRAWALILLGLLLRGGGGGLDRRQRDQLAEFLRESAATVSSTRMQSLRQSAIRLLGEGETKDGGQSAVQAADVRVPYRP